MLPGPHLQGGWARALILRSAVCVGNREGLESIQQCLTAACYEHEALLEVCSQQILSRLLMLVVHLKTVRGAAIRHSINSFTYSVRKAHVLLWSMWEPFAVYGQNTCLSDFLPLTDFNISSPIVPNTEAVAMFGISGQLCAPGTDNRLILKWKRFEHSDPEQRS